jgi:hypothetical protein
VAKRSSGIADGGDRLVAVAAVGATAAETQKRSPSRCSVSELCRACVVGGEVLVGEGKQDDGSSRLRASAGLIAVALRL